VGQGFKIGMDMIAPDGKTPGTVPLDRVHEAVGHGFQIAPPAGTPKAAGADVTPEEEPDNPNASAWEKIKNFGERLFSGYQSGTPAENEKFRQEHTPLGTAKRLGGQAIDAAAGTVEQAGKASAPYIFKQLYNKLSGKPDDLKSIPAAALVTYLAAGGVPEAEEGGAGAGKAPVRVAGDLSEQVAKGFKAFLDRFKSEKEADQVADGVGHTGEPAEEPAEEEEPAPTVKPDKKAVKQSQALNPHAADQQQSQALAKLPAAKASASPDVSNADEIPEDEWKAGQELDTQQENTPKPAPKEMKASGKSAAEKAFLDHLGKTKEDVAAAQAKGKIAYQKHLTQQAVKGAEFGPRGGATPEIMQSAKAAGRQAYLKHLKISEFDLENAKSAARQGYMQHLKKGMADLTAAAKNNQ
jgi:hypothetical protein